MGSAFRNQAKATFEFAKQTSRKAYFHFEGPPEQAAMHLIESRAVSAIAARLAAEPRER